MRNILEVLFKSIGPDPQAVKRCIIMNILRNLLLSMGPVQILKLLRYVYIVQEDINKSSFFKVVRLDP